MRKQLQRQDTGFPSSHQGCMWNLMHILDYHHWHSVKKILPRRKHAGGTRSRYSGSRKATLKNHDNGERKELSAEAEPLLDEEASSTKKKTKKSQIKASKAKQALSPEEVMESSPSKKRITSNQLKNDISQNQFYHVDLLELFKANKEVFLKFLQNPDVNRIQFPGLHKSDTKVRFTKSSSFPAADSSRATSFRPSTLKHKQNEIWSFPKGEKLLASTRTQKLVTSDSQEDSERCGHQGWNQLVMRRFKHIKQRLMHALQESKKENTPTLIETLVFEGPFGCDGKEMSETPDLINGEQRSKIDGLNDTAGKRRLNRVSRTSSLDESLNRYSQLFESSCRSEAKLDHSRSLKLKSEEIVTSTGNAQKSTRRNLSLPDLDSLCSFLNGPARDAFRLGIPVKNVVDHKTSKENIGPKSVNLNVDTGNKSEKLESILETEFQNTIKENCDAKDLHECEVELEERSRPCEQRQNSLMMSSEGEEAEPSETCTLEPCSSELPMLGELCSSTKCEKVETEQTNMDFQSPQLVDKLDDPELNYIRDVLELSGFMGDEYLETWYSMDRPLDPIVFKEMEVRFQDELDFTGNWDHQLLFDLVNETLVDIHERSYTYFPRPLSFSGSKHRPMPTGQKLLEDVWTRISSYLRFRPELVQSLDDMVARDMAKGDTWMNLQWETECEALELEDIIFEELLDEVI
ncbi:protein TRM32-like isoform X2 [Argentina anserina]|uniref:protein TRM32-like isoform X2 n=1 Tax=Argentina anserina TaxID=57926 RepID=UPI0021765235|nr:protein TRM32-like isoform X2 [Potentilla anserina]